MHRAGTGKVSLAAILIEVFQFAHHFYGSPAEWDAVQRQQTRERGEVVVVGSMVVEDILRDEMIG